MKILNLYACLEAGKTILETAIGIIRQQNVNQTQLFEI